MADNAKRSFAVACVIFLIRMGDDRGGRRFAAAGEFDGYDLPPSPGHALEPFNAGTDSHVMKQIGGFS